MRTKDILILLPLALLTVPSLTFAQRRDSLPATTKTPFRFKQLYVPGALIAGGFIFNGNGKESLKMEIREERNEHLSSFHTRIDNYLQYAPVAIAYGLDAAGISSKTDIANRTAILFKGELCMLIVTHGGKALFHNLRPDGSDYSSFPSGHTAQAFAAATFLSEEYKDHFRWMPYAAYGLASSVGALRIVNNKHYISDVLVGAGIGILSMKLSYWTHQYKWGKRQKALPAMLN